MRVRPATPADVGVLLELIRHLADYERAEPSDVETTEATLTRALFGPDRAAEAVVATTAADRVIGMAVYYRTFSTWTGLPGLHLEDLFVRAENRGHGVGRALVAALAGICIERGWRRLEWQVLNDNLPAIGFYRALGGVPQQAWTTYRLSGPDLRALSLPAPPRHAVGGADGGV